MTVHARLTGLAGTMLRLHSLASVGVQYFLQGVAVGRQSAAFTCVASGCISGRQSYRDEEAGLRRPDLFLPPALGLRVPAPAAPDDPLRRRPSAVIVLGRAGRRRDGASALDVRPAPRAASSSSRPHLAADLQGAGRDAALRGLLDGFMADKAIGEPVRLVLHADDAGLLAAPARPSARRLRLHGRAVELQLRAAGTDARWSAS